MVLLFSVYFFATAAWSDTQSQPAPTCPDEKSLTRDARLALVEAQKLMGENKYEQALKGLTGFIEQHPDDEHAYVNYTLAGLSLETGRMKGAVNYYEKTLELCPSYTPAWQNLGKVCYDLGQFQTAAQAFEKTWELTGRTTPVLRYHAAVARLSAGQPKLALGHLEYLTSGQAGPPEKDWIKLLVQLSIETKRSAKALKTIERLLAAPNADPYLFRLAATLNLDLNRYKQAAGNLAAYSLTTPLPIAEQTLLADLYNNLGIPARAAENYQKALAMKPSRKLHERLSSAWFEACNTQKALDALETGLKTYPKSHSMWKLKGWIYYDTQDFDKASAAFAKAYSLNKKDAKSLFMNGLCAFRAGHSNQARKILKQAAAHRNYKSKALALIRHMDAIAANKG
ncbi:MAG: hypothetical protein CSA29_04955 [Desulfobacterales bacterium]|nr:MAG: hypothetical protein CSA29_04955 [Desulfobacterales bacterium]